MKISKTFKSRAILSFKQFVFLVLMFLISGCGGGYVAPTLKQGWTKPNETAVLSEGLVWRRAKNSQSVELLVKESEWMAKAVASEIKNNLQDRGIKISRAMSFVAAHETGVSYFTLENADSIQVNVMNPPILLDEPITIGSREQEAVSSILSTLDLYGLSTHRWVKDPALQKKRSRKPEEISFDPEDFQAIFGETCPSTALITQSVAMGYRDGEKGKEWAKMIALATVTAAATMGMFAYTQKNTFPCYVKAALVDTRTGKILWCNNSLREDGYKMDEKQKKARSCARSLIKKCKLLKN